MAELRIKDNLQDFQKAIETKVSIDVDDKGGFYKVNWFWRIIYWILPCLETNRIKRVANAFNQFLNQIEKSPALFSIGGKPVQQSIDIRICKAAANALQNYLSTFSSSKIKKELFHLKHRVVALNYRFEAENGGISKEVPPAFAPEKLRQIALTWKKAQTMMDNHERLTTRDESILARISQYPEFVKLLEIPENSELQTRTFKAVMRDNFSIDPEIVIEFPGMTDELYHSHMMTRLGYRPHNQQMIRVEKSNGEKRLELLVNGKFEHMHDLNRSVDCGGGLALTFKKIFHQIQDSNFAWHQVEVLKGKGIVKHSTIDLSQGTIKPGMDLKNIDRAALWNNIPVEEEISFAEAQRRYGAACDGIHWGGAIMSTRKTMDLQANGQHTYLVIAEPDPVRQVYKIRSLGKSAVEIPRTAVEFARAVAETKTGRIISPDPCRKDPLRQHRGYPFTLEPAVAQKGIDYITESIFDGVAENMAYNLMAGENCCKWAVGYCRAVGLPDDMFDGTFADARPPGLLAYVHDFVTKMPYCIQNCFYQLFFLPLGSTTSKTVTEKGGIKRTVSLSRMKPWSYENDKRFRMPAILIQKQEANKLASMPLIND